MLGTKLLIMSILPHVKPPETELERRTLSGYLLSPYHQIRLNLTISEAAE